MGPGGYEQPPSSLEVSDVPTGHMLLVPWVVPPGNSPPGSCQSPGPVVRPQGTRAVLSGSAVAVPFGVALGRREPQARGRLRATLSRPVTWAEQHKVVSLRVGSVRIERCPDSAPQFRVGCVGLRAVQAYSDVH